MEEVITLKPPAKKVERHLKWYERQWWSGVLIGAQVGLMLGVVITVPLMFLCKWLVNCWMGV